MDSEDAYVCMYVRMRIPGSYEPFLLKGEREATSAAEVGGNQS